MSGPGKQYDAHRCDACRRRKNRCASCRAERAAVTRERRERKRADGICVHCTEPAIDGLTLCAQHNRENNERSGAAHARARG